MQNKVKINKKMYDVCTLEQFIEDKKKQNSEFIPSCTAILEGNFVYPVLSFTDIGPGVRVGPISFFNKPTKENENDYKSSNIIRFDDVQNIAEMIDRLDAVKKIEGEVLTSVDNIFEPKPKPGDTPEMVALKTAVIEKHIDLDKYEPRFGANYNNDKRLFNKPSISLNMMKRVAKALDMDIKLTITDAPGAPNPIGRSIEVELTDFKETGDE